MRRGFNHGVFFSIENEDPAQRDGDKKKDYSDIEHAEGVQEVL